MIHLKACFHKSVIKYGIILLLLFLSLLTFFNMKKYVDNNLKEEQNAIIYRTVSVKPKDASLLLEIISVNPDKIENYSFDTMSQRYIIIFKNISYIDSFLNSNSSNISEVQRNEFSMKDTYSVLQSIFNVIIGVASILLLILIFLFSINLIYNLEKDIALYKLLGYSQNQIILTLVVGIYLFYLCLFLISIVLMYLLFFFLKNFNIQILEGNTIRTILTFKDYLFVWGISNVSILLSFIRVVRKVKKISPIELIKSY